MEPLYRIEEETTIGWNLAEQDFVKLTKQQAHSILMDLMQQGHNPERLRVVREQ